jgi:hypothetical protein
MHGDEKPNVMSIGYVYAMSNPTMLGLLKVGFTCSNVEKWRRELSGATGIPAEFVIEYFQLSDDVEDIESQVHAELVNHRVGENREFFSAPLQHVIAVIRRYAKVPTIAFERTVGDGQEVSARNYSCHRCGHQYVKVSALELCPSCGF